MVRRVRELFKFLDQSLTGGVRVIAVFGCIGLICLSIGGGIRGFLDGLPQVALLVFFMIFLQTKMDLEEYKKKEIEQIPNLRFEYQNNLPLTFDSYSTIFDLLNKFITENDDGVIVMFTVAYGRFQTSYLEFCKSFELDERYPLHLKSMLVNRAESFALCGSKTVSEKILKQKLFFDYLSGILEFANALAAHDPNYTAEIVDIWIQLLNRGHLLRGKIDHVPFWSKYEISFLDHVRTDSDGMQYVKNYLMPKFLGNQPEIQAWEKTHFLFSH